jgi:Gas vesicle synthesis protein GvpL/GvpF
MSPPVREQGDEQTYGWYVYGIVESDVEVLPDSRGVGEPPAPIEVVRSGDIAALVSRIELDRPLGSRSDLFAHEDVLDAAAADVPVLPMRFGAVVSSRESVEQELLEPHRDEFADALRELTGEAQYVLRARYVEQALMREVLDENPTAAALRDQLNDPEAQSTNDIQLRLGEVVSHAVEEKRQADTDAVVDSVASVAEVVAVRQPTHEQDAAHVAMLVNTAKEAELEDVLSQLARTWNGRINARLLGPMAPYDFVSTAQA